MRSSLGEGAEHDVRDSLRCFDVPGGHRGGWLSVHERTLWRVKADASVGAAVGGDRRVGCDPDCVIQTGQGDCFDGVEVGGNLVIGPTEVRMQATSLDIHGHPNSHVAIAPLHHVREQITSVGNGHQGCFHAPLSVAEKFRGEPPEPFGPLQTDHRLNPVGGDFVGS